MIQGAFLSAKLGATPATIVGTHEWSVNEVADRLEATTGADSGRGRKEAGVIDTRIKIRFYFDVASGVAAFIRAGTVLTDLKLFADESSSSPMYSITSATVFGFNVQGQVRDRFIVDADIEANGAVITFTDAPD
jgi:hypothetical protein